MHRRSRRLAPGARQVAAFARQISAVRDYDSLTGLSSRSRFDAVFAARLAASLRSAAPRPLAFLIVDLTRFREVNFALNHVVGDALLRLVARRIEALLGESDLAARVGTRFPILLDNADCASAEAWARKLCTAFEAPFPIGDIAYEIGARIGLAVHPRDDSSYDGLLRKADIAVEQAAHRGEAVARYDPATDRHTAARLDLIGQFRQAIKNGEMRLYCQPKIAMRSRSVIGAEVLARWHHPVRGLIGPDDFVPLIEHTELIHVLTNHMLLQAARCALQWQGQGMAVPLAVNLSTQDVATPALGRFLGELLRSTGIDPALLELEVTERSLLRNPATSIAELERLHAMGFRLSIDDFGTGFSSLNYLTQLPVDVLKIDHSFTMKMVADSRSAAIVRSTIHLAHDLGLAVVAEGTADGAIWQALDELDCDEAQGYFIARPMPVEDFAGWLATSGAAFAQGADLH
jgi:diguanylate cyclase (GGDEF)-like protein